MIKVRNLGRLGNNLFQFAFGYSASRELGTNFCMDEMGWFHFFQNRFFWRVRNNVFLKYWNTSTRNEFNFTNNEIPPEDRIGKLENNVSYRGYFQSEIYFKKYEKELRKIFQFRKQFVKRMREENDILLKKRKILSINIRGGDYRSLPFLIPKSYYLRAYQEVMNSGFDPDCLLVITDDREYADRLLDFIPQKTFIENRSMEKDFFWLTQSDALIISNSSFSWWGAWLNEKAKITIAPKNWLGWNEDRELPVGIMGSRWKWVEVGEEGKDQ